MTGKSFFIRLSHLGHAIRTMSIRLPDILDNAIKAEAAIKECSFAEVIVKRLLKSYGLKVNKE